MPVPVARFEEHPMQDLERPRASPCTFSGLAAAEEGTVRSVDPAIDTPQGAQDDLQVEHGLEVEGFFGLDSLLANDPSHRVAPILPKTSARVQFILQKRLGDTYEELKQAVASESPRVAQIEDDLIRLRSLYDTFLLNQEAIHRVSKPSKKTISGLLMQWRSNVDISNLSSEVIDWISLYQSQPLEDLMYNVMETRLGEFLFVGPLCGWLRLLERKYSQRALGQIRVTALNFIIAIFFGLPVAVLALKVTTPAWSVAIYVFFVSAVSVLLGSLFSDTKIAFALIIGYASVLANNLGL